MSIGDNGSTILVIEGMGVPRYASRGLRQTLEPIDAQLHVERSIDGGLIDFGYEPFQKYKSTISGSDQRSPACDGVWGGQVVEVSCIPELCAQTYDFELGRAAVLGSIRAETGFTFYRPKLTMMVMHFQIETDEWGAQVGWSMDLEEV
jgi:hypothetical protein